MDLTKVEEKLESMVDTYRGLTVCIMYKGRRLQTPSRKRAWGSLGAAKNALRNAIGYRLAKEMGFSGAPELCEQLERQGIITYKQL